MKTLEGTKKGLETCIGKCVGDKPHCPYHSCGDGCMDSMNRDAIFYIHQLEEREKSLYAALHAVMYIVDKWLDVEPYDFDKDDGTVAITRASEAREVALRTIEKAERERDAAVRDIHTVLHNRGIDADCLMCNMKKPECKWECENAQGRGPCDENTNGNI